VKEVLDATEFRSGLGFAVVAVGSAVVVGLLWLAVVRRRAPVAGLAMAGAGVVAMNDTFRLPRDLTTGMVALAAAGLVATLVPWSNLAGAVLSVPGALLVAGSGGVTP
jgi:hypothetical protein